MPMYVCRIMWDIQALLDTFGVNYRHALRAALKARGLPQPPPDTIKKWRQRNSISSDWLARILLCLRADIDIRTFIRNPDPLEV